MMKQQMLAPTHLPDKTQWERTLQQSGCSGREMAVLRNIARLQYMLEDMKRDARQELGVPARSRSGVGAVAGRMPLADAGQASLNRQHSSQYNGYTGGTDGYGRNSGSGIGKYAAAAAVGAVAGAAAHSLLSDDGRTYVPAGGSYASAASPDPYATGAAGIDEDSAADYDSGADDADTDYTADDAAGADDDSQTSDDYADNDDGYADAGYDGAYDDTYTDDSDDGGLFGGLFGGDDNSDDGGLFGGDDGGFFGGDDDGGFF